MTARGACGRRGWLLPSVSRGMGGGRVQKGQGEIKHGPMGRAFVDSTRPTPAGLAFSRGQGTSHGPQGALERACLTGIGSTPSLARGLA